MKTPFYIGLNEQYGPYAHFGYLTLVRLNKIVQRVESDAPKVPKQSKAKRGGVINPQNYNFNQF